MTKQDELTYLFGILSEASKWSSSPDDNRDFVRMEVEERVRNLINGVVPEPDNLPAEEETLTGTDYQALEAAKLNEHLESVEQPTNKWAKQMKWRSDKVRCTENGRLVWHPLSQCHKEKLFPDNPKSKQFRWVWDGPQDKKEQCDAMWAEHEQEDKEN